MTAGAIITGSTVLSSFTAVRVYLSEQFPTALRGRRHFFGEATGRIFAGVLAPFLLEPYTGSPTIFGPKRSHRGRSATTRRRPPRRGATTSKNATGNAPSGSTTSKVKIDSSVSSLMITNFLCPMALTSPGST